MAELGDISMSNLIHEKCVACNAHSPKATDDEIAVLRTFVPDWHITDRNSIPKLTRSFRFQSFARALKFANNIGTISDAESHHPMILIEWGKVTVSLWTYAISGLHRNDFIIAAKTEALYS